MDVPVNVTAWRATDTELIVTAEIVGFGTRATFTRRRLGGSAPWSWSKEFGYNRANGDVESVATALVLEHPVLGKIADYYDLLPKVDLRTIEQGLRAS